MEIKNKYLASENKEMKKTIEDNEKSINELQEENKKQKALIDESKQFSEKNYENMLNDIGSKMNRIFPDIFDGKNYSGGIGNIKENFDKMVEQLTEKGKQLQIKEENMDRLVLNLKEYINAFSNIFLQYKKDLDSDEFIFEDLIKKFYMYVAPALIDDTIYVIDNSKGELYSDLQEMRMNNYKSYFNAFKYEMERSKNKKINIMKYFDSIMAHLVDASNEILSKNINEDMLLYNGPIENFLKFINEKTKEYNEIMTEFEDLEKNKKKLEKEVEDFYSEKNEVLENLKKENAELNEKIQEHKIQSKNMDIEELQEIKEQVDNIVNEKEKLELELEQNNKEMKLFLEKYENNVDKYEEKYEELTDSRNFMAKKLEELGTVIDGLLKNMKEELRDTFDTGDENSPLKELYKNLEEKYIEPVFKELEAYRKEINEKKNKTDEQIQGHENYLSKDELSGQFDSLRNINIEVSEPDELIFSYIDYKNLLDFFEGIIDNIRAKKVERINNMERENKINFEKYLNRICDLENCIIVSAKDLENMESNLNDERKKYEKLEKEYNEYKQLNKGIKTKEKEFEEYTERYKRNLEDSKRMNETASEEIRKLKDQLIEKDKIVEAYRKEKNDALDEKREAQNVVDENNKRIESLKQRNIELYEESQKLKELQKNETQIINQLNEKEKLIKDKDKEIIELRKKLEEIQSKNEQLQKNIMDLQKNEKEIRENISTLNVDENKEKDKTEEVQKEKAEEVQKEKAEEVQKEKTEQTNIEGQDKEIEKDKVENDKRKKTLKRENVPVKEENILKELYKKNGFSYKGMTDIDYTPKELNEMKDLMVNKSYKNKEYFSKEGKDKISMIFSQFLRENKAGEKNIKKIPEKIIKKDKEKINNIVQNGKRKVKKVKDPEEENILKGLYKKYNIEYKGKDDNLYELDELSLMRKIMVKNSYKDSTDFNGDDGNKISEIFSEFVKKTEADKRNSEDKAKKREEDKKLNTVKDNILKYNRLIKESVGSYKNALLGNRYKKYTDNFNERKDTVEKIKKCIKDYNKLITNDIVKKEPIRFEGKILNVENLLFDISDKLNGKKDDYKNLFLKYEDNKIKISDDKLKSYFDCIKADFKEIFGKKDMEVGKAEENKDNSTISSEKQVEQKVENNNDDLNVSQNNTDISTDSG